MDSWHRGKYDAIAIVDSGDEPTAVAVQKETSRGNADPFIAVDKWVVVDERGHERGSFGKEIRVEVNTVKGRLRLRHRGGQQI